MINLNHLRFARVLAQTLSFSGAAQICCVTQPTLSNGISQLEDALGGALFKRTTRQVDLTRFGQHMLPLIEESLRAVEELRASATAWHDPAHKLLRIGLSPVVDMAQLETSLAPYRASHPDVQIFFKQCFIQDLHSRLQEASIDLGVAPHGQFPSHYTQTPAYQEPLYYLPRCLESDPPPQLEHWPLVDAAREPMILTQGCGLSEVIKSLFANQGVTLPLYPGHALDYASVENWAELGIGGGVLPHSKLSEQNPTCAPLLDGQNQAQLRVTFIWPQEPSQAPHLRDLQELLSQ
ncbi:LysR family transcriptional regulator [Magnetococcus sp. PR-3]|uniref:LysR family transcriptional regulator n=1 Tax=Magnetococcus sp. PR-3 TaxID=3120355 RepID=UPI002FCE055F